MLSKYEQLNLQDAIGWEDPFTQTRYSQFYRHFSKDTSTVLDVGCNMGQGGQTLKKLESKLEIFALDCAKDKLERLPKGVYKKSIYGLSTDIPVEDNSFDIVTAGEFIEHLYPADVEKTLSEFFRVLRPKGRLLLTTPNPYSIKNTINKETVLQASHVSQHFPDALKFRLKMIGFSRIKVFGSGKISLYLGTRFPFLGIYGSYLLMGDKY